MQLDPFPSNPVHGPLQFPAKLRQGSLKKKKKRQTYYTHSGYLLLLFFFNLDVSFSIGVRGKSRKGCSWSG